MTTEQVQQVRNALMALIDSNQFRMFGSCPGGPVLVGLAPGNEPLAHRIWAQYGNNVAITIGLTSYDGSPGRSPLCGILEPPSPLPVGLRLALHLQAHSVRSGSSFNASVIVSESGPDSFLMDTGQPLQAVVVRPGTRQVVGVFSDPIGGTGYGPPLAPGQTGTIPVVGGTARCDGEIGSALPPGNYQVVVRVAPEGHPSLPSYLTPPVALRVS